jgi:hypothetical protein
MAITIDLSEISQSLDRLRTDIHYDEARDTLNEASRRLRRVISPFQFDDDLKNTIARLKEALENAKKSLNNVRPTEAQQEAQPPFAVYNAIEADFAAINGLVADLLGLFEQRISWR